MFISAGKAGVWVQCATQEGEQETVKRVYADNLASVSERLFGQYTLEGAK